jgi:glycosyltransferase involved in cell wall biosynthesis
MSTRRSPASMTVVVPAYDEARILPGTIEQINDSARLLAAPPELIVVDNRSTDGTGAIAARLGARVVTEPAVGIARARNAGARHARGEVLVFIDADACFPAELLPRIADTMADPGCLGGAADPRYHPRKWSVRVYLGMWRLLARALKMSQGAVQFCRADVFEAVGGYDERYFIGEDVDFVWRLRAEARRRGAAVEVPIDVAVSQSARRFDRWPLWRTLLFTNPLFILLLRRRASAWAGWYERPPR